MTHSARLMCMFLAAAALALPAAAAPVAPDTMPFAAACPGVNARLARDLYPAWRAIDSAAQILVQFKLDGDVISDVQLSGGHGDYIGPVRHAVRAMKCSSSQASAVRFRIVFQYPEDQGAIPAALAFVDAAPRLAKHAGARSIQ